MGVLEQRRAADRRVDDAEDSNDDGVLSVEDRSQNVDHDREFKNSASGFTIPVMTPPCEARAGVPSLAPGYMSGFGNSFETEVLAGALPIGRNSPQRVQYGLYAEQLSGPRDKPSSRAGCRR
jgi:hypothetical protein